MPENKKDQTQPILSRDGTFQQLEKLIGAIFAKLLNAWQNRNAHTGIQFYVGIDD